MCFNCGWKNHISGNCVHKDKGLKCFRCEAFGLKASERPDKNDTKPDDAHLIVNKEKAFTKKISYSSPFVGLPFFPVHLQSRLEDQPIPGWPCGVGRYFQATLLNVLRIPRSVLSVLGAGQLLDALRR
ncbi:hypothetical protein TNCV_778271 [Trichonephila clavipes]|nr:hypothetical protein TNCV_778271 [Trichonephila clavipes]